MTNQQRRTQDVRTQDVRNQKRGKATDSTTYRGFLVRLWKDGDAALWRSSAQSVQTGMVVRFARLTELFAFLEAQTDEGADAAPDEEMRVGWRSHPTQKEGLSSLQKGEKHYEVTEDIEVR